MFNFPGRDNVFAEMCKRIKRTYHWGYPTLLVCTSDGQLQLSYFVLSPRSDGWYIKFQHTFQLPARLA